MMQKNGLGAISQSQILGLALVKQADADVGRGGNVSASIESGEGESQGSDQTQAFFSQQILT